MFNISNRIIDSCIQTKQQLANSANLIVKYSSQVIFQRAPHYQVNFNCSIVSSRIEIVGVDAATLLTPNSDPIIEEATLRVRRRDCSSWLIFLF